MEKMSLAGGWMRFGAVNHIGGNGAGNHMGRKGFYPLFTTLGLLLVIMVVAVSIVWGAGSDRDFGAHADRMAWLKLEHAVGNVRSMAADSVRGGFYEEIVKVGVIPGGKTLNPYLEYGKDEGWQKMLSDIQERVSSDFSSRMGNLADYSDGQMSTFSFDGINITMGRLSASDLRVVETGDGVAAVVRLPLTVSSPYYGWAATISEENITIPLNVRLKDIYGRAWEFHSNYNNLVTWTFTGAIYARAYAAAYLSKSGPFLKEPHYDFDPIGTVLFGDIDTLEAFSKDMDTVLDIGAIPAATWLAEWQYLSEPGFLPAGLDLDGGDEAQASQAIMNSYRMGEYEEKACDGLGGSDLDACRAIYDPKALEEGLDALKTEMGAYEDIYDAAGDWLSSYDTSDYEACKSCAEEEDICEAKCRSKPKKEREKCEDRCESKRESCEEKHPDQKAECRRDEIARLPIDDLTCDEFREDAIGLIEPVVTKLKDADSRACEDTLNDASQETGRLRMDGSVKDEFDENDDGYGFEQVDCDAPADAIGDLQKILDTRLTSRAIDDNKCSSSAKGDCPYQDECEDGGDCNVHCSYPRCGSSGESYDCLGDVEVSYRVETCRVCEDGDCDYEEDRIDTCKCRCRASMGLLLRINGDMKQVYAYVEKTVNAMEKTYDGMEGQLENRERSDELAERAGRLDAQEEGYDVFSRVTPLEVRYDEGEFLGGKECYYKPTFADRDKGVCGDSAESAIMYTVQIAAAGLATIFSGGATSKLLEEVVKFFPMIFETGAKYNLTESLIDDGNRVMLTDLAGGGAELYTYAPFEFQIYKNRQFELGSATLGRTLVYVYWPTVGMQRIMDGLASPDCSGVGCK